MRIIAGKARGRKILSPEGSGTTRPTLDRIKEAIFSMIQFRLPGARALDLFSGTGSLGLEAVSRGAEYCALVDKSPVTFKMLAQNVINLNFTNECETFNMEHIDVLKKLRDRGEKLDVIFVDPPYFKNLIPYSVELIGEYRLLKEDGIIVSKIDTAEPVYEGNELIEMYDKRKYGNTTVCLYRYK